MYKCVPCLLRDVFVAFHSFLLPFLIFFLLLLNNDTNINIFIHNFHFPNYSAAGCDLCLFITILLLPLKNREKFKENPFIFLNRLKSRLYNKIICFWLKCLEQYVFDVFCSGCWMLLVWSLMLLLFCFYCFHI